MCTSPITIKSDNSQGLHYIHVPCGKCCECKKTYQNDWMIRLFEESKNWSKAVFFTLTYNENTVPFSVDFITGEILNDGRGRDGLIRTVYKKDIQDWLKRWRENSANHSGRLSFKYFITSEYGPRTLRPHYHGIFFGLDQNDIHSLLYDWRCRYGFVSARNIDLIDNKGKFSAVQYVSKYCSKGVFENPRVSEHTVRPTFHLISKGIGKSYISKMKNYHLGRSVFTSLSSRVDDFKNMIYNPKYLEFIISIRKYKFPHLEFSFHLPRYYSSSIYGTKNSLSSQIADFLFRRNESLRDKRAAQLQAAFPDWSYNQAYGVACYENNVSLQYRERTLRASLALFYDKSKL